MRGAVIDKSFTVAAVVGWKSFAVTTNLQRGIDRFQGACSFLVQRIKLLRSSGPEQPIRLIPKFPIANVVVIAICPALVVVHGNVLHHVGKLVEVLGRIDVCTPTPSDSV